MRFYRTILILGLINHKVFGIPPYAFERWCSAPEFDDLLTEPVSSKKQRKNVEIPVLTDYLSDPGSDYWSVFPFNPLPDQTHPNTPLKALELERLYSRIFHDLTYDVQKQMLQCKQDILYGADSLVDLEKVKPLYDVNSKSLLKPVVGALFTDQLVTLIKSKFVSGPFDHSPFENLRINSLFCVEQKGNFKFNWCFFLSF